MIKKIDLINKPRVFDNFDWNTYCRKDGNIIEFRKLNIIYGRNYSGKTTLSRLFSSFEKGCLQKGCSDAEFSFSHTNSELMRHDNLNSHPYAIRVYNKDFVEENLKFLRDQNADIEPFAVMGDKNVAIEKEIEEKEKKLGNVELKNGLRYELQIKRDELENLRRVCQYKSDSLQEKLRKKANEDIKVKAALYNDVNYNITKINNDIALLKHEPREPLPEKQVEALKRQLTEESKKNIPEVSVYNPDISSILQQTQNLLEKEIKPTACLRELLDNAVLQEWVRNGIDLHKNKRNTCAFCNGKISSDLWGRLDAHFSKESENLRNDIGKLIENIETKKLKINSLSFPSKTEFYTIYHNDYDYLEKEWKSKKRSCCEYFEDLIKVLNERQKDIFNRRAMPPYEDISSELIALQGKMNQLVFNNNKKTLTLRQDKQLASENLRLNEINNFIKVIDYDIAYAEIKTSREASDSIKTEFESIQNNVTAIEKEIEVLRTRLKDEKKAADKVNEYLNHFFGHKYISLVASELNGQTGVRFEIKRGSETAYNLSEGECSLIAFCYFMAKLEDVHSKGKNLIIWIDDPICSLDNNHIFFVFSLIESAITKAVKNTDGSNKYRYGQLFISTHNLDFLKYLKRLTIPQKKIDGPDGKKKKINDCEYFILERINEKSFVKIMPDYLRNYVTEFNYLFHQIYKCSKAENAIMEHDCFYSFGNNLRKFLEAYLFYKYPDNEIGTMSKLEMFFDDSEAAVMTNRISNELSHLEEIFDRGMKPLEIPEISKLAEFVIKTIKKKDKDQYHALLKSVGENDILQD